MATKYILVGGYIKNTPDGGKAFCEELVKDFNLNRSIRILDCMFARPVESWKQKLEEDRTLFSKYINNFELELADVSRFTEQVKSADVIFIRGGGTYVLMDLLTKDTGWIQELDGKTLAGTSAGAEVIAKYYYHLDYLNLNEGLGLLPIKFFAHFNSNYNAPRIDWDRGLKELKNHKEDLPIYALKEGEFKVIQA